MRWARGRMVWGIGGGTEGRERHPSDITGGVDLMRDGVVKRRGADRWSRDRRGGRDMVWPREEPHRLSSVAITTAGWCERRTHPKRQSLLIVGLDCRNFARNRPPGALRLRTREKVPRGDYCVAGAFSGNRSGAF